MSISMPMSMYVSCACPCPLDIVRENPTSALSKFEQVVEIGKSHASEINDESRTSMFNSLVHITTLLYQLGKTEQMINNYK